MKCDECGATLSAEEAAKPSCVYCGKILPHRARAVEKAAMVSEILADRDGDGVPDVFEGMVGNAGGAPQSSQVVVVDASGATGPKVVHQSSSVARSVQVAGSSGARAVATGAAPRSSSNRTMLIVFVVLGVVVALVLAIAMIVAVAGGVAGVLLS